MVLAAALRPLLLWAGVGWGEYEQGWSARNMGRGGVGEYEQEWGGGDLFTFPVHCQPGRASNPRSSCLSLPGAMVTGVYHPAQLEIYAFKERKERIQCGAENTAESAGCLPGIHRAIGPISQCHVTQLRW